MKSLFKCVILLLLTLSFASTINGGYEFQATLSPNSTPFLTFEKNNLYLNIYGNTSDTIKDLNLSLSLTDKMYLNSFKTDLKMGAIESRIFIKDKNGTSKDWLNLISADKLGNNYMGLILQSPSSMVFYGLENFNDTSTKYKTIYFQQRVNYKKLFGSFLYSDRSSDLKTTYEDLYAADFTYKMTNSFIKGEIGYVDSNDNKGYDILNRSFIMLGYQDSNNHITFTDFNKGFSYSISSYQPMLKVDAVIGDLTAWYYKNLKIGGEYQPTVVGNKIKFSYYDPNASTVNLAGSFNGWNKDSNPMVKDSEGLWTIEIELSPGTYQYKFVIDGNSWVEDPYGFDYTDDGYGGFNSVITIIETANGIAISMPKDKFEISYRSAIGNFSFGSNFRDEVNQTGNYLYKFDYSKDLNNFGINAYIGYPEDSTNISSPDSYSLLLYKKGSIGNINYEIGFKPILYSPNLTDKKGYLNISCNNTKANFTLFSNNTYNFYLETTLNIKYGSMLAKMLTDFNDYTFYANLNLNVFSPAIVQLSIGNSDFDTYKKFKNEFGLYVKTTF